MERNENDKREPREEVFSQVLRAGKRTYFFDVKITSNNDYYLTITESKKRFDNRQGRPYYEKHKIFLYKEDFDNFMDSFSKTVDFIKQEVPAFERRPLREERELKTPKKKEVTNDNNNEINTENFSNVDFDDLGNETENTEDKTGGK